MGWRSGVAASRWEDAAGGMDVVGFRWQVAAARWQATAGAAMRAAVAAADPLRNWRAEKYERPIPAVAKEIPLLLIRASSVHGIILRGWRAATRRKRDDLMPGFTLAFADILRDPMDVVIELRSETPLDAKDFIVWIRNHLRSP